MPATTQEAAPDIRGGNAPPTDGTSIEEMKQQTLEAFRQHRAAQRAAGGGGEGIGAGAVSMAPVPAPEAPWSPPTGMPWPPVGSVSELALLPPNPPSGFNRDGTYSLRGDRKTIRDQLDKAGITMFLPIQGGLMIGTSQAQRAHEMVEQLKATEEAGQPPADAPVAGKDAGGGRAFVNPADASMHDKDKYPFAGRSTITDPDILNPRGLIDEANKMPGKKDLTRQEVLDTQRRLARALQRTTDNRERLHIIGALRSVAEAGGQTGLLTPEEVLGSPGATEAAIESGAFGGSGAGVPSAVRARGIGGPVNERTAPPAREPSLQAKTPPRSENAKGITNPEIERIKPPDAPPGKTRSQLGREVIGWGAGPKGATERAQALTADQVREMQTHGLTKEMATQWAKIYANESARNSNNETAYNRAKLMEKIIRLMD